MITSSANPKIKYVARLQAERRFRWRERAYVVEGERAVRDVVEGGFRPKFILHDPAIDPPDTAIPIDPALMKQISDVETPPGILAVVPFPDLPFPESPSLLLILDGVQTPGNMGTMLRTAAAAGVDGVLLAPGCVDPFNSKVVRGGMGAQLRLPLKKADWDEIAERASGLNSWVGSADADQPYTAIDWQQPSALIIGNEANGPSAEAYELASGTTIPMATNIESLNAAMAAGIILFEAARQRREE